MSDTETRESGMQIIGRIASILRVLHASELQSLGDIAKATGLPRSTVQRLVNALAAEAFVEGGIHGVRLGSGLLSLATHTQFNVVQLVRPALETLFAQTNESVDLSIAHGTEVHFVDRIISNQELRVVLSHEHPQLVHTMANGKVILAETSNASIRRLLHGKTLRLTKNTICDIDELLSNIKEVRETGFAYDLEEHAIGICAVSVPLILAGQRTYALSVAVPTHRFQENLDHIKKSLMAARMAIEESYKTL